MLRIILTEQLNNLFIKLKRYLLLQLMNWTTPIELNQIELN